MCTEEWQQEDLSEGWEGLSGSGTIVSKKQIARLSQCLLLIYLFFHAPNALLLLFKANTCQIFNLMSNAMLSLPPHFRLKIFLYQKVFLLQKKKVSLLTIFSVLMTLNFSVFIENHRVQLNGVAEMLTEMVLRCTTSVITAAPALPSRTSFLTNHCLVSSQEHLCRKEILGDQNEAPSFRRVLFMSLMMLGQSAVSGWSWSGPPSEPEPQL